MSETKVTDNEIINHVVSSSNLGSRSQGLTASGGAGIAYSTNNPTITLKPGRYMIIAIATARANIAAQDSSFRATIYNDTTSSVVASNGTSSTSGSVLVYPTYSVQAIETPTVNTTYSARLSQTYGTGATYTYVHTALITIPL